MLRAVAALVAAAAALGLPAAASAADFVVSTGLDGNDSECSIDCTLREAIALAGPADRVVVPSRPHTLSDGPIALDGDTIVGGGARTTVIDAGNSAIFTASGGANQVSGVTLTGGDGLHTLQGPRIGGAVDVAGQFAPTSLTMTSSTIRGNTAWAGGGIAVRTGGTLRLVRSTISGNISTGEPNGSHGGGIYLNGGTVTLENVTVSGNTATDAPGAPGNADGGGIYVGAAGTLTAQNVTLAANRASGDDGLFREPTSTSTVTLNSTVVASGANRNSCSGSPSAFAGDHNLSDDTSCGFLELTDRVADPQLGVLAANGGPTDTHALAATSAAVDAGARCPATDQRGAARAGACDMGAFEYVPPPLQPGPPPPPPPPPPGDDLPPPVAGKTVNARPKSGRVRVKVRGQQEVRAADRGVAGPGRDDLRHP